MNWTWVILIILGALVLFTLYLIKTRGRKLSGKRAWPTVVGIISHGWIEQFHDPDHGTTYWAAFNFYYLVSGSELRGGFTIGNLLHLKSLAENAINKHPGGSTLQVRYNPENPNEYFTEFDKDQSNYIRRLWIYLILLLIAFSCLFLNLVLPIVISAIG